MEWSWDRHFPDNRKTEPYRLPLAVLRTLIARAVAVTHIGGGGREKRGEKRGPPDDSVV